MTPDEYCQQKAAASGSSFYYSFLFLPPERRRAITALYAFCREVDDVVDEANEMQIAAAKLGWWRAEVANLFAGRPQHPVTKALAPHTQAYAITPEKLNDIIDAAERGSSLTHQLLAYARGGLQQLGPADLNATVESVLHMLRRIEEICDVDLSDSLTKLNLRAALLLRRVRASYGAE